MSRPRSLEAQQRMVNGVGVEWADWQREIKLHMVVQRTGRISAWVPVPWDMHDLEWKKTKLWLAFQKHYSLLCEEKGWEKKDPRILFMWESMMTWSSTRAWLTAHVSLPVLCSFAVQPPSSQQTALILYYNDYVYGIVYRQSWIMVTSCLLYLMPKSILEKTREGFQSHFSP